MPKKATSAKPRPLYRRPPPKPRSAEHRSARAKSTNPQSNAQRSTEFRNPHFLAPSHFTLREDGTIGVPPMEVGSSKMGDRENPNSQLLSSISQPDLPRLTYSDSSRGIWLYHGNSLELLDAIAAKYPEGRFDAIFADPPYFLSNGGITCHAGKMVKVDKGDWDVSRGPELNHEFNTEWLRRCQRVLKPNGTIWVTGTHHVIFSIGYALQQLGFKILNDIAWEKPNPPPNLSCRYFTHSTETVLWAAKNEKSKHVFNYQEMRAVTGKQMKTVWRDAKGGEEIEDSSWKMGKSPTPNSELPSPKHPSAISHLPSPDFSSVWTITAPGNNEKQHGRHPTQKPVALIERCLLASTNEGDLVLDPFLGGGTTAVVSLRLKRGCVGVEADLAYISIAAKRVDREIIDLWLHHFRIRIDVSVVGTPRCGVTGGKAAGRLRPLGARSAQRADPTNSQIDLAIFPDSINGSRRMAGVPEIQTERIFHECKFVFLSCAQVERGAVVHTTVDVSLQEAWAKTPTGKKRETTHIVRCETEIFRIKT